MVLKLQGHTEHDNDMYFYYSDRTIYSHISIDLYETAFMPLTYDHFNERAIKM